MGIIFQFFQLLPALNLKQNVILPMDLAGKFKPREGANAPSTFWRSLASPTRWRNYPVWSLADSSSGLPWRAPSPMTPPSSSPMSQPETLTSKTAATVFDLFNQLVAEGKTVIIVTHDSSMARHAQRTALIADGEIVNEYVAKALPTHDPGPAPRRHPPARPAPL